MKILFFTLIDSNMQGYMNKIRSQVKAMTKLEAEITYTFLDDEGIIFQSDDRLRKALYNFESIFNRRKQVYNEIRDLIDTSEFDVIMIRFGYFDPWFLKVLNAANKTKTQVILEIPTYPYRNELWNNLKIAAKKRSVNKTIIAFIKIILDYFMPMLLRKKVDFIYTYSSYSTIWNIPVLEVDNGVDLDNITKFKPRNKNNNTITAIAVGYFQAWHAYERFILGLARYKENGGAKKINLILVGEGPDLDVYKDIIIAHDLSDDVELIRPTYGDELDKLFNRSDFAISSLGGHTRKETKAYAPLKTREYCARGIPFIYSYPDKTLNGKEIFAFKVEEGSSPINMVEIIEFAEDMQKEKNQVNDIRDYAEKNFDWKIHMKKVLDHINVEPKHSN